MTNDLLDKLIKKINFEHANNFELAVAKEYSFVPINVQGDSFFVAVSPEADKEKIIEYIKPIVDKKIEFIFLSRQNFDTLFDAFLKKFSSKFGSVLFNEFNKDPFGDVMFNNDSGVADPGEDLRVSSVSNEDDSIEIDFDEEVNLDEDDELDISNAELDSDNSKVDGALGADLHDANKADVKGEFDKMPDDSDNKVRGNINSVDSPTTKKIGEILIEEGLITDKQLTMALAEAKVLSIPLGSVLVKMGFITIKELKEALGAQMGVKLATAEQLKALPTAISILPEDFVRENKVIPLSMTDKSLVVGMVDPGNSKTINEIVYQTGLKPTVIMVTHYEYEAFLQTYYENEREAANKMLREIESERVETTNDDSLWDQVENEIQDTSGNVAKFANKIVTLAIDQHASDIHIEPRLVGYVVRFRIDGTLREVLKIPAKVDSAVVSRFKVLARMNIAEHRRAQDGNFSIKYKRNQHDFRVNTLPVGNKEKMVIRILAPAITDTNNDKEINIDGISAEDKKKIEYIHECILEYIHNFF